MSEKLFDVIEVEIKQPNHVRLIARNATEKDAKAIVKMAVVRRGVKDHFFTTVEAGKHRDGDNLRTP